MNCGILEKLYIKLLNCLDKIVWGDILTRFVIGITQSSWRSNKWGLWATSQFFALPLNFDHYQINKQVLNIRCSNEI